MSGAPVPVHGDTDARGARAGSYADPAVAVGRGREDVVVGDEIVRHRLGARVIHWSTALFFVVCLLTGMPIWSPIFGWMASLFGGLAVCRWLHPLAGVGFSLASVAMFALWARAMVFERSDRGWLGPKLLRYMRYEASVDRDVGKYNGGQKLLFWAVALGALALLASGVVLWFPESFSVRVREVAILLHDVTFVLFTMAIVGHVYLGTAAEPGTFHSMTRGTVTKPWARLHHPRWYREVTGDDSREE
jgi:formate dehydrogenase subunit gamma